MNVLNFDQVIECIESQYNFDNRHYSCPQLSTFQNLDVKLDFWHWICQTFELIDNAELYKHESDKNVYVFNFDKKLEEQRELLHQLNQKLSQFNFKASSAVISVLNSALSNDISIPKKDEFENIEDILDPITQHYTEMFYKFLKNVNKDIAEELAETNPLWIKEIVNFIDKEFGQFKDKNGNYYFDARFEY